MTGAAFVVGSVLAVALQWPLMAIASVFTLGMVIDANNALRTGRTTYASTLLLDITLAGGILGLVGILPIGMGIMAAYYVVLVAVLGKSGRAWPIGLYAVAVAVFAPYLRPLIGLPDLPESYLVVGSLATVLLFATSMTLVVTAFASLIRERIGEEERRVKVADAVGTASRALVAQDDPKALRVAASAIRGAVGSVVVFIEQNVDDPSDGASALIVDVSADGPVHPTLEVGAKTPWSALPETRSHLSGGAPFFFRLEEAEGTPYDRHGAAGIRSEVNMPVVINGTWVGVVGACDTDSAREWDAEDLRLLRNLADLTAAFWQRIEDLRVRDSLIGSLDGRLRFEEALAKSSKALLGGTGVSVEDALESVGVAARVDEVFITRTVATDDAGTSAETIASWTQPGLTPDRPVGTTLPYAGMQSVIDAVHRGAVARVTEGETSELSVGIEANGGWFGTVGFLRRHSSSPWSKRDASFIRTIGDILGAYYERAQNREQLESLISGKDRLIASVSHELRTPLTAVVGLAEELSAGHEHIDGAEQAQLLDLIANEAREMADLVEDLLAAARSSEGEMQVFPERTDLSLLATSVANRITVHDGYDLEIEDVASPAYADPVRVRQIIRNLLTNAVRYGGRHINVRCTSTDTETHLDVVDDGPGIAEGDRERIFEPYGRANGSATVTGSVGLGLTLSRRLAELMGGTLDYIEGDGATFRLTLPRGPSDAE